MTDDIIIASRERKMRDGKVKRINMRISEWCCEMAQQGPEVFIMDALEVMKRELDKIDSPETEAQNGHVGN